MKVKGSVLTILILFATVQTCIPQSKFQFGFGFDTGLINFNKKDNYGLLKTPYGFSLHGTYELSQSLLLKSKIELHSQYIEIPLYNKEMIGRLSVPLLLNKSFKIKEQKKLKVRMELGFSWDVFSQIHQTYFEDRFKATIQSQSSRGNVAKSNISGRLGFDLFKVFNNHSSIHFYAHFIKSLQNWDKIYLESVSNIVNDKGLYTYQVERRIINLARNEIQVGIYFNFAFLKKT